MYSERENHLSTLIEGDALCILETLPKNHFNLVVSSPPYNLRKIYERDETLSVDQYTEWQDGIVNSVTECVADNGSVCWQVGSYIKDGELLPLDVIFYELFKKRGFKLRNRIVWRFNFGHNADRRFSGRYETILWFTKTNEYKFNLNPVRIPQLYPGKRHAKHKGEKGGLPSGNPLGKNPSDYWEFSAQRDFLENPVWNIPNVKSRHPEKTEHPCQFPIELVERCVMALTDEGDFVLDPFVGTGATVIAAVKHKRRGFGIDKDAAFLQMAKDRLELLESGSLPMRPPGMPIRSPCSTEKVSRIPDEWQINKENESISK